MRKISRRNFLLASGAVTISAALSACGGSSSSTGAASSVGAFQLFFDFFRSFFRRFRCSGSSGQGAEYLVLERRVPGPLQ